MPRPRLAGLPLRGAVQPLSRGFTLAENDVLLVRYRHLMSQASILKLMPCLQACSTPRGLSAPDRVQHGTAGPVQPAMQGAGRMTFAVQNRAPENLGAMPAAAQRGHEMGFWIGT